MNPEKNDTLNATEYFRELAKQRIRKETEELQNIIINDKLIYRHYTFEDNKNKQLLVQTIHSKIDELGEGNKIRIYNLVTNMLNWQNERFNKDEIYPEHDNGELNLEDFYGSILTKIFTITLGILIGVTLLKNHFTKTIGFGVLLFNISGFYSFFFVINNLFKNHKNLDNKLSKYPTPLLILVLIIIFGVILWIEAILGVLAFCKF